MEKSDPVSAAVHYTAATGELHARRPPINHRTIVATLSVAFVFYTAYVYTDGTNTGHAVPMSPAERDGARVYQAYNCVACHQFYGLGGYMGPDLTNVISRRGKAYTRAFIVAGTARMPNLGLAAEEVDAVIDYLAFVDRTGSYPAEDVEIEWYGTVAQRDDPQ